MQWAKRVVAASRRRRARRKDQGVRHERGGHRHGDLASDPRYAALRELG